MPEALENTKHFVSIFVEEYNYHRKIGLGVLASKRKALEYNRRYTKREVAHLYNENKNTDLSPEVFLQDIFLRDDIDNELFRPDGFLLCEGSWNYANISPEEMASFNQLFSLLFDFCTQYMINTGDEIGIKYISYLVNVLNVGQLLDEPIREKIQSTLSLSDFDNNLRFKSDLANFCGFKTREGTKTARRFETRLNRFK